MFHRIFVKAFIAAFVLGLLAAPVQAAAPTIAILDIQKIQKESKSGQSLQKQIQAKRETLQKEFSSKEAELKKNQDDLIGQKEKLSAEEFTKKLREFEKKVSDTKALFEKRNIALTQGIGKANREFEKGVMEAAAKVAEAKQYDIVLPRDSVLIAEKSLDITPEVLKELDASLTDIKLSVQ
jgi:outer membrane protein